MGHSISVYINGYERGVLDELNQIWNRALKAAMRTGNKQIVRVPLKLNSEQYSVAKLLPHLSSTTGMAWRGGTSEQVYIGLGVAASVGGQGTNRFQTVKDALHQMKPSIWSCGELPKGIPTWLGGFAFHPGSRKHPWTQFPDAYLLLPSLLVYQYAGEFGAILSLSIDPHTPSTHRFESRWHEWMAWLEAGAKTPCPADLSVSTVDNVASDNVSFKSSGVSPAEWREVVEQTAHDVAKGDFEKVVLARRDTIRNVGTITFLPVWNQLVHRYPDSYCFAISMHGSLFFGASPERLASIVNERVSVDCLAGTTGRGQTDAEDERMAEALLQSGKDRHEHQVVVDWITNSIDDVMEEMSVPNRPALKRLANVQHLWTPITGKIRSPYDALDIVTRLHPTPAVAGVPRESAIEAILEREQIDRGWYAGAVGWLDNEGNGDFSVALRSAVADGQDVHLFAGAGIMADSTPESEWLETELKLRPIRDALKFGR